MVCEFPNRLPVLLLEPNADVPNAPPLAVPNPVSEKVEAWVRIKFKSGNTIKNHLIFLNILHLDETNLKTIFSKFHQITNYRVKIKPDILFIVPP